MPDQSRPYPPSIDHLVWLAADLDTACKQFEAMSGVTPDYGGQHPGGTHNALVGLGESIYLEIAAPVPGAQDGHPWINAARQKPEPHLFSYCMRPAGPLADLAKTAKAAGFDSLGPLPSSRKLPNGDLLEWQLLIPHAAVSGGIIPFQIDWLNSPHPSAGTEQTARLIRFEIVHPEPQMIRASIDLFAPQTAIIASNGGVHLRAQIETPRGVINLLS